MPPLRLLGPPQWQASGQPALALGAQRAHQVLAVLAWCCSRDLGPVPRARLAALFWPDRTQEQARANLRKVLLELRGQVVIDDSAAGLHWRPGSDVDAFIQACDAGDWPAAARLGQGLPLQGLDAPPAPAASAALGTWLCQQRHWHHGRWRAAVLRALPGCTPDDATVLVAALLRADPHDAEARALQPPATPAPPSPSAPLAPLAPLVGRDDELPALLALLATQRLVTVLGPGGVGKSRLARHAADALASQLAQGVALVTLDDLSTPAALPERLAHTLALPWPPATDAAAALARALAPREQLLVLDGFEAVIDAAPLALRLLGAAPGLRLLVTSRERLDVDGECLFPLSALPVPAAGASLEQMQQSPAVQLFATRARAVQPRFDLAAAMAPVADICRRVGGLPLAIEWAAAWMRVMPAEDLAHDIATGAVSRDATGPLAVFESSWRLLTTAERRAYAALSVFRGGFSRDAALAVAGVPLALLAALVDKSMLRVADSGRLDMHALVHEHALGKQGVLGDDERSALAERHARHYLARLMAPEPLPEAEHENLLVAWHHVVRQRDEPAVLVALARLQWSTVVVGRRAEAVALLGAAATAFGAGTAMGACLRVHQAWILLWLDEDERACAMVYDALVLLRAAGHAEGLTMGLRTLGHAARRRGDAAAAVALFEDALRLPQPAGVGSLRAALHDALAMAHIECGAFDAARVQLHLALALNEAAGDEVQRMYNHYNLARSHSLAGDMAAALPWAESALAIGARCGFPFFLPYLHAELTRVAAALGQAERAAAHAQQALAHASQTGDNAALAGAWEAQARVALLRGDQRTARQATSAAAQAGLASGNRSALAPLLPLALQAFGGDERASRWHTAAPAQVLAEIAAAAGTPAERLRNA